MAMAPIMINHIYAYSRASLPALTPTPQRQRQGGARSGPGAQPCPWCSAQAAPQGTGCREHGASSRPLEAP